MKCVAAGNRLVSGLAVALTLCLGAACTTDIAPTAVGTVAFTISQDSVLTGKTYQTLVVIRDVNGVELQGKNVLYESLFPNIATVDTRGLVTAVAPGGAAIKATVDGRSAQTNLKVLEKVTRVVVTPLQETVPIGQTRSMVVTVTAATGTSIGGRAVRWQSSNPTVAIVSNAGVVSGVAKGTATITADVELDQVNGSATVTVIDVPVSSISLSPAGTQIMRLGAFLQLTASPRDVNNNPLTGRTITWASSNPAVASVSSSGLVSAIALGTVSITAECEGRSVSVGVQVTEVPPRTVTLSPDTVQLLTGNTRQLVPTVIDSLNRVVNSLATRSVLWTSSNPAVASVSSSGVVTGITGGTARVNVTVDNVRSNDVVFIVTDQVQSVRLTPSQTPPMRVGNTLQITAAALNNQNQVIPGKTFTWTSTNPSVATVNASGLVTAVAPGSVNITAETEQKTASLNISVTLVPIGSVTLVPSEDTLIAGDQKQYNPVVTDSAGRPVTSLIGRNVIWNSNNIPVAGVTGQGIVQASTAQSGTAAINVTIDGVVSNNLNVKVSQVAAIQVTPNPVTVKVGNTVTLSVVLKDVQNNTLTTNRTISYFVPTANPNFITVSPAGVVTGVTQGTTNITVTVAGIVGVSAVVPVTINP